MYPILLSMPFHAAYPSMVLSCRSTVGAPTSEIQEERDEAERYIDWER